MSVSDFNRRLIANARVLTSHSHGKGKHRLRNETIECRFFVISQIGLKNGGSRRLLNGGHRNLLRKPEINGLIILRVA
jgi:hypothetical protein